MGRLIGTTTSYSFLTSRNFTNAYTYDAASNRTGFTDPESGSTAYSYDTLNRLTSLAPPSAFGSGSFGFSYDALSRRTQMTRPNSVTTNYSYDNLSRLTSVLHQLSGSTIDGASYMLDSAGNRTAKTDQLTSGTSNYTYDAIYQLTQVTQANNTTESYSYDAVGNRTASLGVSSYTTNASNELTATSNASYTYDSNGNTLTKTVGSDTTTYAWDFENRLSSVTLPGTGGTVSFKYDPFGRRIEKSSSTATSVFAYDGDNLIEETNSSGAAVGRYTQTQNIDEPLSMLRSSATSYYNADGLGSVTSLTNSSGAAAETYAYDSFGKVTTSSGSLTNPLQYTGREMDPETGLYYYRARYYDPSVGRFLSEDPIGTSGDGPNFYLYALNEPVGLSDPSGLDALPNPIITQPLPGRPFILPDPVEVPVPWGRIVGGVIAGVVTELLNPKPTNANDTLPKCQDPDCTRIVNEIYRAMNEVTNRIADLLNDPLNLYGLAYDTPNASLPPNSGTFIGHLQQVDGWRRRLLSLVDEALRKRCPIPAGAWGLATRKLPSSPRGK